MKLAVFSDIHGNLEALEAVCDSPEFRSAERSICLGDVIGYGADPSACLARTRATASAILLGNHESAVIHPEELAYFNGYAKTALEWTRDRLSDEEKTFLGGLPLVLREPPDFLFVHAAPGHPESWDYIMGLDSALPEMNAFTETICFVGHSHVPLAVETGPGIGPQPVRFPVAVLPGRRYLVNVGSVGQPRDRDARSAFVVYDTEARVLDLHRISYPIERAQEKINAAQLPPFLAARIASGR